MKHTIIKFALLLILILFSYSLIQGIKQNQQFENNLLQFEQINKKIELQYFSDALSLTHALQSQLIKPSSSLSYIEATLQYHEMNYDIAAQKMYETLLINPHLIEDEQFLLDFLDILIAAEKWERAQIVLNHCKKIRDRNASPYFSQKLDDIEQTLLHWELTS